MCWLRTITFGATFILMSLAKELIVVGPNSFRSNQNYVVALFNMNIKDTLKVSMIFFGDNGNVLFSMPKDITLKNKELQRVEFKLPDLRFTTKGRLIIKNKNGTAYYNQVELEYIPKSISGLVQLSKPVYKPGDRVQFRVIVLDLDLKPPSDLKMVTVIVQDSVGNNIRKWPTAKLSDGVFEGQLYIAPSPLLGTYNIIVEENNEKLVSKSFEVKEYVLSTIKIDVYPTVIPLEEHQALDLTIKANYHSGYPVIGTAKVDLYIHEDDEPALEAEFKKSIVKGPSTWNVNGTLQVHIPFADSLSIVGTQQDLHMKVTFTEGFTNRTIIKENRIAVYKHEYQVKLLEVVHNNNCSQYTLKIKDQYGRPAAGVDFQIKDGNENSLYKPITSDQAGIILSECLQRSEIISVLHAGKEIMNFDIEIDEIETIENMNIKLKFKIQGNWIVFQLQRSHPIQFFLYYVVSKGNIVYAKDTTVKKDNHNYTISVQESMLPRAKLVVVTVINGTLLHDSVNIEFDVFSNNVMNDTYNITFDLKIKDNETEVSPGSQIELILTGPHNAYVALASYDQSLLQHGTDHDVVREDIWNLVDKFHNKDQNNIKCFQRMGLFSFPESDNKLCRANDKTSRQYDSLSNPAHRAHPKFRTNFSEHWLWENHYIPRGRKITLIKRVPHTITSWSLTGFSIHPVYGFGIIKHPLRFTTAKAFYIVDHLPYSIRRHEPVLLQFTLFNTLGDDNGDVTLCNENNEMEFIGTSRNRTHYQKSVVFPKNAVSAPVSFLVEAKTLGEMAVQVKATNNMNSEYDVIEKVIRVLPEDLELTHVETEFFASDEPVTKSYDIPLNIPTSVDNGSVRIEFSVAPNIFTFVIPNLENLLSIPTGCGEQNMVRFVPNVVVLDFLYATQSNATSAKERAKELLQTGYQNQMQYRKSDGSFAVFRQAQGGVFLTAFVGKSFHIASKYITVEENVISTAFDWIATKQQPDGRFYETGDIFSKDMQGGLRDGIALTSYVMIAFLESESLNAHHSSVIEKGMAYIANHIDSITDLYDLSIATYALWLNNHSKRTVALNKLIEKSSIDSSGNARYWPRKSSQIETTAYALLSLIAAKDDNIAPQTARWLFNQTYETGSFPRTQDTFVGLKALAKFSERFDPVENIYDIELRFTGNERKFHISSSETLTYADIPSTVRNLQLKVSGKGDGLLRVTYKYLLNLINFKHRFNITLEKKLLASQSALELTICSNFEPEKPGERSNMALVEVTFPSGYVADPKSNSELKRTQRVQNVEYLHGGTMVVVYYNNMGNERNCFTIMAYMRFKVALRRPAYVKVHDYYNPKHNAIHVYDVQESNGICDICPKGECSCK